MGPSIAEESIYTGSSMGNIGNVQRKMYQKMNETFVTSNIVK